jgi:hypothetical protein
MLVPPIMNQPGAGWLAVKLQKLSGVLAFPVQYSA